MPVYVDDMKAGFGRMVMCHMVADTLDELHAMADKIGVARRWYQGPPVTRMPHYDIALSKRALAVQAGAQEIKMREAPAIARRCLAAIPTPPKDWCTDPDNCRRCKSPSWDQLRFSHAGIPLGQQQE